MTLMLHDPAVVTRVDRGGRDRVFRRRTVARARRRSRRRRRVAARRSIPATVLGRLDDASAARITGRLLASGDDESDASTNCR